MFTFDMTIINIDLAGWSLSTPEVGCCARLKPFKYQPHSSTSLTFSSLSSRNAFYSSPSQAPCRRIAMDSRFGTHP